MLDLPTPPLPDTTRILRRQAFMRTLIAGWSELGFPERKKIRMHIKSGTQCTSGHGLTLPVTRCMECGRDTGNVYSEIFVREKPSALFMCTIFHMKTSSNYPSAATNFMMFMTVHLNFIGVLLWRTKYTMHTKNLWFTVHVPTLLCTQLPARTALAHCSSASHCLHPKVTK